MLEMPCWQKKLVILICIKKTSGLLPNLAQDLFRLVACSPGISGVLFRRVAKGSKEKLICCCCIYVVCQGSAPLLEPA